MKWYVDASYASHADMRGHTGACVSVGKGTLSCYSRNQKVNTRSSMESELVSVDNMIGTEMWMKQFIEA